MISVLNRRRESWLAGIDDIAQEMFRRLLRCGPPEPIVQPNPYCDAKQAAVHRAMLARFAPLVALSIAVACPGLAYEQDAVSAQPAGLEEIVVTAEKRTESIQRVPISITSLGADQLDSLQIHDPVALASVVSNLSVYLPNGSIQPIYGIRGISTADFSVGQDGPVALYYDEVYKGNPAIQGTNLFDLERIEVLKGPQGTLYGKNTTGGAINFVSRVPDFTTEANVTSGYSNYNHFHADGGAQTAITDLIAVRIAFTWDHASGWFTNTAPGEPDLNSVADYGIRATLLFKPNDRFNLIIRASTSRTNPIEPGEGFVPLSSAGVGPPILPAPGLTGTLEPFFPIPRESYATSPRRDDKKADAVSVTAKLALTDEIVLTSITSWDHGHLLVPFDNMQPIPIIAGADYGSTTQVSQDFRLTSQFGGRFNFIVGGYYNREYVQSYNENINFGSIDLNGDGVINAADCIAGGYFVDCSLKNNFDQLKQSLAVYADGSYMLDDQFKLHAGLRYTHDRGNLENFTSNVADINNNYIGNLIPGVPGQTASLDFSNNNVSGRLGVDYNLNAETMLYLSFNRGYRGAAFNNQAFFLGELNVAAPETVSSYEVGFKSELLSHRVRFDGALFDVRYRNQQVLSVNPVTTLDTLIGLDKSRVRGAELALSFKAAESLTLSSTLGVLDTRVVEGMSNGESVNGNHLSNAPNVTASGTIDWTGPIADRLRYELHLDGAYTGKQYFDLANSPSTAEGGFFLANARVRFSDNDNRLGVTLWVRNLTDRHYLTSEVLATLVNATYVVFSDPRMYGVSVDAKF